jgi:hypothetical protein
VAARWRNLGPAERLVLGGFALAISVGFTWGLPGSTTWAVDAISPRSCGLGAIVETYWPGHFHTYPPLHMALLTVLSLPWIALGALRVGTGRDELARELIKPLYMTGIEMSARAVAAAMALAIVLLTVRWWTRIDGRRTGIGAGVVVAANSTLVYYAHTGNLEVPYLFWASLAMLEMDRVLCGEPRERAAVICSVAAVLSKDQAAAVLAPLAIALFAPSAARGGSALRRAVLQPCLEGIVLYAVVSGALVNPVGFGRRVAFLVGPASQTWAGYPRSLGGDLRLARDAVRVLPHFTSWPIAGAAIVGIVVVIGTTRGIRRMRALQPFVAALSFTLLVTLGVRRSEDRFLLPETIFLLPYSAVALSRAVDSLPRLRVVLGAVAAVSIVLALLRVASLDATLLVDSRYAAERFLASLPSGTHVEILGTTLFLPRLPPTLFVVRPGTDPIRDRQPIPGVTEVVDPDMDPRPRAPAIIVLATALSQELVTEPPPPVSLRPYGSTSYHDDVSHRLFRGLFDGSLGYRRSLVARCELPWPLECRQVHQATGQEVWMYSRETAP